MADLVITRPDIFAADVEVAAYEAIGTGRTPSSGAPAGSSADSATVQADGTLTFDGLTNGKAYILYAATPDRYLRVFQSAVQGSRGTVIWSAGGVPPRASGVRFTDWIGPDDPAANAVDGDTWIES